MTASFATGTPLWEPSEEVKQKANVTQYIQWLAREKGLTFQIYEELWEWSLSHLGFPLGLLSHSGCAVVAATALDWPAKEGASAFPQEGCGNRRPGLCNTVFWQDVLQGKYA